MALRSSALVTCLQPLLNTIGGDTVPIALRQVGWDLEGKRLPIGEVEDRVYACMMRPWQHGLRTQDSILVSRFDLALHASIDYIHVLPILRYTAEQGMDAILRRRRPEWAWADEECALSIPEGFSSPVPVPKRIAAAIRSLDGTQRTLRKAADVLVAARAQVMTWQRDHLLYVLHRVGGREYQVGAFEYRPVSGGQ